MHPFVCVWHAVVLQMRSNIIAALPSHHYYIIVVPSLPRHILIITVVVIIITVNYVLLRLPLGSKHQLIN